VETVENFFRQDIKPKYRDPACGKPVDKPVDKLWKTLPCGKLRGFPQVFHSPLWETVGAYPGPVENLWKTFFPALIYISFPQVFHSLISKLVIKITC